MSRNSKPRLEQTFQQAIYECLESIQADFADAIKPLKPGRRLSTPPPLNHEDPFSPSSDECASVGSPIISGNDEHAIAGLDDVMFGRANISQPHANIHSSQDLYKKPDHQNKENNNQRLFPAFSNNTNDVWTSHCDTKVRSYRLPEMTFTGCICKSTLEKTPLSVPEIITEGLLVNKFLNDFEAHIKQSNLNIENHWYGLMEICFKGVRDKHIELYMWFKKRLYEGLPWASAQAIIKHQIGFESCTSKKQIEGALPRYRQGPRESFSGFYHRFESYVAACKALSLYSDHDLIYQFISHVNIDVHNYMKECLLKLLSFKRRANTLPFPEEVYSSLLIGDAIKVLSKVPSSWEEFANVIVSAHSRKLSTISDEAVKKVSNQMMPRRINRAKLHERNKQSFFGGTRKTAKFA